MSSLLVPWPPGDNDTDTIINGVHFNLTTLENFGYLYWANDTVSNNSWCTITLPKYVPTGLLQNGTWIDRTGCYTPVYRLGTRSAIGLGLAVVFGLMLVLILINLTQHGKLYITPDKRFYPIGRRWQWYWGSWICAMALIGLFFGVDIDRYYVTEIPIVITNFAWFLMQFGSVALVWEAVRHWGSWKERQFVDPNPFVLHEKDRRGMFEFWLPLWTYFWLWMNFFMIIPRNWTPIMKQRSEEQTVALAVPAATDGRFKAAGFFLVISWITILVSLFHSIKHYEPRHRGTFNQIFGSLGYIPLRFALQIPLLAVVVAYQILCSFNFELSPMNVKGNVIAIYVAGYVPTMLILLIQIVDGFIRPNEDKELLRQRRVRGAEIDRELGITKKPAWWKFARGERDPTNMREMVERNVQEINGRKERIAAQNIAERRALTRQAYGEGEASAQPANGQPANDGTIIEMNDMSPATSPRDDPPPPPPPQVDNNQPPPPYSPAASRQEYQGHDHAMQFAARLLFPNAATEPTSIPATTTTRQEEPIRSNLRPDNGDRTPSTTSGLSTGGPPQQIRSMLDV